MIGLDALLVALVGDLPIDPPSPLGLVVDRVAVTLPIEARIGADGRLRATAPRGALRTGFDHPHGELSVAFTPEAP